LGRSTQGFTFSPKNAKQETPKPTEKIVTAENSGKAKPVEKSETPERKAPRASISNIAQAPETPKATRNVMLFYFGFS
jgi:hypothetical protein